MRAIHGLVGLAGPLLVALWFMVTLNSLGAVAQQDATCSLGRPCAQGCCSKSGSCGFTDAHCKDGCISNCNATAECGQYAPAESRDCPINTCCSQHGYCGTTSEFCDSGCQKNSKGGGCGAAKRPECGISTDAKTYTRRIAYYELFTRTKTCNRKEPADLPLGVLTHLNLAFVNFDKNFKLVDDNWEWVTRVAVRKIKYPNLKINIAVGGWAFNDPPTASYWSDMASTKANRAIFIKSVVDYIRKWNFDGVDLDWEYPVAPDRGGKKEDADNYVSLLREMRIAFDQENTTWEISVTVPSSYWYLRGFKLKEMDEYLTYWNLMSYDIHGMWDLDNEWTGPWLRGHTEWPEIDEGLDLLWRNDIDPKDVVMGFAFYGRSFTMADPNCHQPNRICRFTGGGFPADCSATEGILTYNEIASRNNTLDVITYYNKTTTVKYNVYSGSQWVSYDDAESFHDKLEHLSQRCLSGLMIWAIDQDTSQWDAMNGLFGDFSGTELEGLDGDSAEKLHDLFGQFNGQDCFVTERCTDGSDSQKGDQQVCPSGYASVETAHSPYQRHGRSLYGTCDKGSFRHICCPKKSMPHNCKWTSTCNVGKCDLGQFALNTDPFRDAKGNDVCSKGKRTLCCDGNDLFDECFWTPCDGEPRNPGEGPSCPRFFDKLATRQNQPDGSRWCSDSYFFEPDNKHGSPLHDRFSSSFCCPEKAGLKNCRWSNHPSSEEMTEKYLEAVCKPQRCRTTEIQVTDALDPPRSPELGVEGSRNEKNCDGYEMPAGFDAKFPLCCSPPSEYNEKWPVDPKQLWQEYWNDPKDSSVAWKFANNYHNNNQDSQENSKNEQNGDDAYGFLMLDGPKGAIDDKFGVTQTVVRRSKDIPNVKRELLTTNQTLIDQVFEHSEETIHVYCNYPVGSAECEEVFIGGAVDTIISLPSHVGEGPFARIVSMELAAPEFQLPAHHLEHRLEKRLETQPVYEVKIDYNFHAIEARDDTKPVNIRVDYTNMLGYWNELTDSAPSRIKRGMDSDNMSMHDFRSKVQRGVKQEEASGRAQKRSAQTVTTRTPLDVTAEELPEDRAKRCAASSVARRTVDPDAPISKRWWGTFVKWLDELTSVRQAEKGVLPLEWADRLNIFNAQWGCPGQTFSANLRMDLEARLSMDAVYAYYLSARFVPPQKPEAFFYFGMSPNAYLGLVMKGDAVMQTTSGEKKIIDTIGYPGLAVKGIAAVGPTLDLYGELRGKITLSGEAKAGVQLNFGKAEVYWPQDDASVDKYDKILDLELKSQAPANSVEPTFEAGVKLDAQLDIILRPEANVGIKVGGSKLTAGKSLVDAQVTAYMRGALSFQASGQADTNTKRFDYRYGVYLLYNVGFKAKAVILEWKNWAMQPREAYRPKDKSITLYEKTGSIDLTGNSKRWITLGDELGPEWDNNTISWDQQDSLIRRASSGGNGPNNAAFTQQLTCPAGANAYTLPGLRLNCETMPARTYGTYTSYSFCDGYGISAISQGNVQTHDPTDARRVERRAQQCPTGTCAASQAAAQLASGHALTLDCDEFPPASAEEGGSFHYGAGTLCVPSYQNNQHGQCVRMMSFMQTNVGKLETSVPFNNRVDAWVDWRHSFWTTNNAVQGSARQRFTNYDEDQPTPAGYFETPGPGRTQWTGGARESWNFKRNYTFQISDGEFASSNGPSYVFWEATNLRFTSNAPRTLAHTGPNDRWKNVVCAVNIFGQTSYFREPQEGNGAPWNAYCLRGTARTVDNWPASYGMSKCYLTFGVGVQDKRSEDVGGNKDWELTGIEFVDDEIIPLDGAWDGIETLYEADVSPIM